MDEMNKFVRERVISKTLVEIILTNVPKMNKVIEERVIRKTPQDSDAPNGNTVGKEIYWCAQER